MHHGNVPSATCQRRRIPLPTGLPAQGLQIMAVTRGIRCAAESVVICAEPAFLSVLIGTAKVKALQTARERALTCTAATDRACSGTHSAQRDFWRPGS